VDAFDRFDVAASDHNNAMNIGDHSRKFPTSRSALCIRGEEGRVTIKRFVGLPRLTKILLFVVDSIDEREEVKKRENDCNLSCLSNITVFTHGLID
jgi:hypothetical protein